MPFHSGELAVQKRVGVREQAEELLGSFRNALTPPLAAFLAQHRFAVLSSQDAAGNLWASALAGPTGIFDVPDSQTFRIALDHLDPQLDPSLISEGYAALLVIDFMQRLRIRINGQLSRSAGALHLRLAQLYGNCTKYIQRRTLAETTDVDCRTGCPQPVQSELSDAHRSLITRSDTFFIATISSDFGADASHRGGRPGFVTSPDAHSILWPDYRGNNMFNTLGNLELDSRAGLLFIDFDSGASLQLSGIAVADFGDPSSFTPTGRSVRFTVSAVRELPPAASLRYSLIESFPYNPPTANE